MSVNRCINPGWIPTDKPYTKHDGSIIHHMKVGCGKCTFCQRSIKLDWIFRMEEECKSRLFENQQFVTLTYSDYYLNAPPGGKPRRKKGETKRALARRVKEWHRHKMRSLHYFEYEDIQLFIKRLRQAGGNNLKMFAVAEYGSQTWRPHWHLIIWGSPTEDPGEYWKYGHSHTKPLHAAHIQYVVDYLNKDEYPEIMASNPLFTGKPQFRIMSKGIGKNYFNIMSDQDKKEYLKTGNWTVVNDKGVEHQIPRYYTDKIRHKLTEEENTILTGKILERSEQAQLHHELERMMKGISNRQWAAKNLRDDEENRQKAKRHKREPDQTLPYKTEERPHCETMGTRSKHRLTQKQNNGVLRQHQIIRPGNTDQRSGSNEQNRTATRTQQTREGHEYRSGETIRPTRDERVTDYF